MAEERGKGTDRFFSREADSQAGVIADNRQLDLLAFGVISLVIALSWLPTLASAHRINPMDDFFLHASRHEAVRKSLFEYHVFPLRSHWFGGGFPTLGEPEDAALNPLVLLSVLFGSVLGPKLMAFVAVLASGLATYALARHILDYTRWGALFSALIIGTSLHVSGHMWGGNLSAVCAGYLPLCMLLIALSCAGRRAALFLLPFVLYTMLSDGKQTFFTAALYLAVLCLLGAVPRLSTLTREPPARKSDVRPLAVLVLALAVTFFVGMVRILPALEFIHAKGGLTRMDLYFHAGLEGASGPGCRELLRLACGIDDGLSFVTIGWLPIALFAIAACCFCRRSLPWLIALVLFLWLALGNKAPLDLFGLLARLPIFSTIAMPYKYFCFQIVLCVAMGAGQFFWLLPKLRPRWLEHLCAVALIIAGVSFLYSATTSLQRETYTDPIPSEYSIQQEEFFSVQGWRLPRNRVVPPRAVTYLNLLQNIGTIDWHTAMPIAENAIPRHFVDAGNRYIRNPRYRGEAFFIQEAGLSAKMWSSAAHGSAWTETRSTMTPAGPAGDGSAGYTAEGTFRPNSITVQVTVPRPGILVVNQNYHPAWRTDRGELFDSDGLIALRLHQTGSYTIHLRYLPRSFLVGLAVTALSGGGWLLAWYRFGRPGPGRKRLGIGAVRPVGKRAASENSTINRAFAAGHHVSQDAPGPQQSAGASSKKSAGSVEPIP